ncbi:hypothetical protein ANN_08635 [Periplaneta americana]|uniref:Uncharacterized protein n=1 Tax=Periplaneta americana TaxID=6978 RepID=A0ABQ8T358_PERAM|nr:hypothetical protein ANN_08635 [Periplaneta americana]
MAKLENNYFTAAFPQRLRLAECEGNRVFVAFKNSCLWTSCHTEPRLILTRRLCGKSQETSSSTESCSATTGEAGCSAIPRQRTAIICQSEDHRPDQKIRIDNIETSTLQS